MQGKTLNPGVFTYRLALLYKDGHVGMQDMGTSPSSDKCSTELNPKSILEVYKSAVKCLPPSPFRGILHLEYGKNLSKFIPSPIFAAQNL